MSEAWDETVRRLEVEDRERQRKAQTEYRPSPEQEIERLRALLTKAANALDPFAHQATIIDQNDKADGNGPEEAHALFRFRQSYTAISIGDCRRAKEALEELRKAIQ